jgi:hypothetical protein
MDKVQLRDASGRGAYPAFDAYDWELKATGFTRRRS